MNLTITLVDRQDRLSLNADEKTKAEKLHTLPKLVSVVQDQEPRFYFYFTDFSIIVFHCTLVS